MVTATSTRRSFADDVREIDEFFRVLVGGSILMRCRWVR